MKFNTRLMIALSLLFGRFSQWKHCANRFEAVAVSPSNHEITVIFRRLNEPDGYSREELVDALCWIRKHQMLQGWTEAQLDTVEDYAWCEAHKVAQSRAVKPC